MAAQPRFTEYAHDTAGRFNHSVRAELSGDFWTLTLMRSPVQPQRPPADVELTNAEYFDFIRAQSTMVAARRIGRQYVGDVEVRPGLAADELVKQLLGSAWCASDRGRGYGVEISGY